VIAGIWRRWTRGERRLVAADDWPRFAGPDWADTIMTAVVADRHFAKQGRSIARWTLTSATEKRVVYLKRHYRLGWFDGLRALLHPGGDWSPGMGEHRNLEIARKLGVPVPAVSAAAEWTGPGLNLQSVLAVDELQGMLPLHEAVPRAAERLSVREFAAWKRGLTVELVRLTRILHESGWFHKDLYFCHFYIPESDTCRPPHGWIGRVHMIDFHRLGRHALLRPWYRAKDLGQFLYSSEVAGVRDRDRLRFWRMYAGRRPSLWMRAIRAIIEMRARTNRRHNKRRPQVPKAA
jgi:Lipopolysaccharide kinase (Kdo/WaaP) family